MYFIERGKGVCHILEDTADGRAPCGVHASQLDMIILWAGRQAPNITTQPPPDVPLCEHCAKDAPAPAGASNDGAESSPAQ